MLRCLWRRLSVAWPRADYLALNLLGYEPTGSLPEFLTGFFDVAYRERAQP